MKKILFIILIGVLSSTSFAKVKISTGKKLEIINSVEKIEKFRSFKMHSSSLDFMIDNLLSSSISDDTESPFSYFIRNKYDLCVSSASIVQQMISYFEISSFQNLSKYSIDKDIYLEYLRLANLAVLDMSETFFSTYYELQEISCREGTSKVDVNKYVEDVFNEMKNQGFRSLKKFKRYNLSKEELLKNLSVI